MAAKKTAQAPNKWPDGTWHATPWTESQQFERTKAKPGELKIAAPGGFIPYAQWQAGHPAPPSAPRGGGGGSGGGGGAAPSGPLGLPVDAGYDDQSEALGRTLAQTQAGIAGERQRTLSEYGFTEDPTNGALALDPNNPFSKATLLKALHERDRRGAALGMGARGQLYAGAMQTGQDFGNYQQLQGEDALQKSLTGFLSQNTGQRAQAGIDYQMGMGQAYGDRTARAASNPLYSPDVRGGAMPGAAGGAGATPGTGAATGGIGKAVTAKGPTLKAGPNVKGPGVSTTTKKTPKGKVVTYKNTVLRP